MFNCMAKNSGHDISEDPGASRNAQHAEGAFDRVVKFARQVSSKHRNSEKDIPESRDITEASEAYHIGSPIEKAVDHVIEVIFAKEHRNSPPNHNSPHHSSQLRPPEHASKRFRSRSESLDPNMNVSDSRPSGLQRSRSTRAPNLDEYGDNMNVIGAVIFASGATN